jgi:hypothetical protein
MDATNPAARRPLPRLTDVVTAESAPRPTAVPPRVHFASVLATTARGLVRGAEQAMTSLPGGPLVALAIRGTGAGSGGASTMSALPMSHGVGVGTHSTNIGGTSTTGPEGPQPTSGGSTGADGSIQSTLQQSQDMNLYFLQIQEEVNAQNRAFSALSNVLKAEHDTVKTAIGNIR